MRKRIIAIVAIMLSCIVMFCGCDFVFYYESYLENPRESDSEYIAVDEGDPREEQPLSGNLELQIWTNESDLQATMWKTVIDKFEEVTGVKVTAHIGSQVNTQMSGRWTDGNPPDVVALAGSGIPDMAFEQSGVVADLTDIVENGYVYGVNKKISDVVSVDRFVRSSETAGYYRMATTASAYGVFYDQNLLTKLGLSVPTNFTQLMSFVPQAIEKGYAPFTSYGTVGSYNTWAMIVNALASYGQDFLDGILLGKKDAWASEEARTILSRWEEFCDTKDSMLKGTTSFDHTTAHIRWLNREAILCGDGIWLPWEVKNNTPDDFDMQYASSPLIGDDQKPAIVAYTSGMMVAQKAKNPENARAFIRFLYTKFAQQVFVKYEGFIPMRNDLKIDEVPGLSTASKKILEYIYSGAVDVMNKTYLWGDLNEVINGVVQQFMTKTITVDKAIETITAAATK